jgi:hypothetical protein
MPSALSLACDLSHAEAVNRLQLIGCWSELRRSPAGTYTYLEYARFADDLVILVDAYAQHDWLLKALNQRL